MAGRERRNPFHTAPWLITKSAYKGDGSKPLARRRRHVGPLFVKCSERTESFVIRDRMGSREEIICF